MLGILEGDVASLIAELRQRMTTAAEKRQFEQAAKWRDVITNLEAIFGSRNRSFRFAAISGDAGNEAVRDLRDALGLPTDPSRIVAFDVSNTSGEMAVASLVSFADGRPDRRNYRRFRIRGADANDDTARMSEAVRRHFDRLLREERPLPELLLLDGGKGQLSAVLATLVALQCPPLPVVALAKRQEEIHIPGEAEPIILDRHRPALRLVQWIRDEAHRFAVAYHREIRSRRLQESLLDEIPGIGETRKRALLRAFGSVRELRKATPDEIVKRVPGIGAAFAEIIAQHLKRKRSQQDDTCQ
jgi:excinuclease ABC subunit C